MLRLVSAVWLLVQISQTLLSYLKSCFAGVTAIRCPKEGPILNVKKLGGQNCQVRVFVVKAMKAPPKIPNRYEFKYLIPECLTDPIRQAIAPFCELDKHAVGQPKNQYVITSLYLDTPGREFHRAKAERQSQRFKLRIRTYGIRSDGPVFLEVKRKSGDIIAKNRTMVDRDSWSQGLTSELESSAGHAERDFRSLMDSWGAGPMLLARYHREPWVSVVDDYARVTFDRQLLYQPCHRYDLLGEDNGWLAQDDAIATRGSSTGLVLELKSTVSVPRWMIALARRFDLMRMGYSKYCTGVERVWGSESMMRFTDRAAVF